MATFPASRARCQIQPAQELGIEVLLVRVIGPVPGEVRRFGWGVRAGKFLTCVMALHGFVVFFDRGRLTASFPAAGFPRFWTVKDDRGSDGCFADFQTCDKTKLMDSSGGETVRATG